jgi:hypothetical protein
MLLYVDQSWLGLDVVIVTPHRDANAFDVESRSNATEHVKMASVGYTYYIRSEIGSPCTYSGGSPETVIRRWSGATGKV